MAKQIFTNGASCKLGAAIVTTGAIASITLETGKGALFPNPSAGDWFVITLIKADYSAFECFKCSARTGDVATVDTRAYDGSTAATWSTSDLAICSPNAGALADLRADIATLQAAMTTAQSDISSLSGSVASLTSAVSQKPRMDIGTKVAFFQAAAPTGWTQDVSVNDKVLRVVSGSGGGSGGSWTITGVTVDGHVLTESEIPSHVHGTVQTPAGNGFGPPGGGNNLGTPGSTAATGGGQAHTHGLTADGNWRPAYIDVIVCARAS